MQSMKNHGISYYWFVVWSNHLNLFHSAKLGTLGSCNLLLSDVQQGDTPRSLFIYKRWINSIHTIRGKSCSRHYSYSFSSYFYYAILFGLPLITWKVSIIEMVEQYSESQNRRHVGAWYYLSNLKYPGEHVKLPVK